jgi:plastocyanin
MTNYKRASIVLGAVSIVLLLAACGGDEDKGAVFIDMKDNFFGRQVTRVPVGQPVLFRNDGHSPHNATAVDASWSTESVSGEVPIDPGEHVEVTIQQEGVYEYFCTFHGSEDGNGMSAVLVVGDVDYDPASGTEGGQEVVSEWTGRTLGVPDDYATIQSAVDATEPGDLVLVEPGTYREQVTITTPSITLRGTDRDDVVIDGEFERPNAVEVFADGVAVENITAQNAVLNGFIWSGVTGYRGSYLNAYNNADYGIFAFDSTDGLFEYSYASGSPDSGFYIGQCHPCNAVIDHVESRRNSLGYSGTNAGGDLYILRSLWRDNRAGIVPNTLDTELLPPESETTIVGNTIIENDYLEPVAKPGTYAAFGNGIVLAGGNRNLVSRNRIDGHGGHGILVTPNLDENFWFASGNVVTDNVITDSDRADIALAGPAGEGNCFERNGPQVTTIPVFLHEAHGCSGLRLPLGFDLSTTMSSLAWAAAAPSGPVDLNAVADQLVLTESPSVEQLLYEDPSAVEERESLDPAAPVRPAVDVFANYEFNLGEIEIPSLSPDSSGEELMALAAEGPGVLQLAFNLYGYLLPILLLAMWSVLAVWDIARRDDVAPGRGIAWIALILVLPFIGALIYLAFGGSQLAAWLRWAITLGGLAAYLVTFLFTALVGGVL